MTGYTPPRWSITPMRATTRWWSATGSSPSTRTDPPVARRYPSRVSTVEVLPAPFGPSSASDLAALGRQRQAVHRHGGAVAHHEVAAFDGGAVVAGRDGHRGEATVAPHDRHPPGQGEPRRREGRPGPSGGRPRRGRCACSTPIDGPATPRDARDELRSRVKDLSRQVGEARRTGDTALAADTADQSRAVGEEEAALDAEAAAA